VVRMCTIRRGLRPDIDGVERKFSVEPHGTWKVLGERFCRMWEYTCYRTRPRSAVATSASANWFYRRKAFAAATRPSGSRRVSISSQLPVTIVFMTGDTSWLYSCP